MEKYFSNKLKQLMDEKNLKQLHLAIELGIRQSQVHNWLKRISLPNMENLAKLSKFFKVPVSIWFEESL